MTVKNCPECNQVFLQQQQRDICFECYQQDVANFQKVRTCIRETPSITLNGLSKKSNISLDTLLRWKRTGRI
jgi:hypothetical protein